MKGWREGLPSEQRVISRFTAKSSPRSTPSKPRPIRASSACTALVRFAMAEPYDLSDSSGDAPPPKREPGTVQLTAAKDDSDQGPLEVVGSLAEISPPGDFCPRCGKAMGASSVVCTNCGFDLRTSETAKGITPGVAKKADADVKPDDGRPVLCVVNPDGKSFPPVKWLMIFACVCALAGAVLAAVFTRTELPWWVRTAQAFLVLLSFGIHTATGVGALYLAAIWLESKVGSLEVAAGRMAAAVGVFLAVLSIPVAAGGFSGVLAFLLAAAAYLLVICVLFRRRIETGLKVSLMHFGVAGVVQGGLLLYQVVAVASEAVAVK